MNKRLIILSICTLVFNYHVWSSNKSGNTDKNIVILFENDVHCAIDRYQKLAGLRDAIADTAYVGIVSCGDYLQGGTAGAISQGKYVADVMKYVNYDAVTLGNHEFDYKVPRMNKLLKFLNIPVTCVNLQNSQTKKFPFAPYIIKDYGDKKIAFVGATTPTARNTEEYSFVDNKGNEIYNLQPDSLPFLIQKAVNNARKEGADYVFLIAHLGEDPNDFHSDSHTIISKTYGIDAVLDGHTHSVIPCDSVLNKEGKTVLIAQTGTKLSNIGHLFINKNGQISINLIPIENVKQDNPIVKEKYERMLKKSQALTEQVIGNSEIKLLVTDDNGVKVIRRQETNGGDIVADAFWNIAKTDIAMINAGGVRTSLKQGTITYGKIIDMLPYDNKLQIVEVNGETILRLLTECTTLLPKADGDFPQVAGIKFVINGTKHEVSDVQVWNKQKQAYEPIDLNRNYTVVTLDYTVTGGGFRGILKNAKILSKDAKTASEILIQYVRKDLAGKITKEQYGTAQERITIHYDK